MRLFRLLCYILILTGIHAVAQVSTTGSIAGSVVDPQGAVVPQAAITVTHGESIVNVTSDELGRYTVSGLVPGTYTIQARANGFRTALKDGIAVDSGAVQHIVLSLEIEEQEQQVEVSGAAPETSPEKNGGAIVLKGRDLQGLSEDPNALQQQLQAIAGSDPESGTQFFVDGFSSGKLPPKSSIREIRINQNPYSAQYDQLGYGRVEIFTKPGTDKFHGDLWMQGNDSPWNTQNPFVKTQPAYYSYQYAGSLNGPMSKSASFFSSLYNQHGSNNVVVNAIVLDSELNQATFTQAVSAPASFLDFSPRMDFQAGKNQTLSLRYQLQRTTQTNGGVGQFALQSQAFDTTNVEQVLQFSDTQAYGAKVVNETRFQYTRDRNDQAALNSSVTVNVQGAFTGGGNSQGRLRDKQDHYELQDYLQITAGKHNLNMGVRLRSVRDSNYSTANFNGQFTFASLAAYQITLQGLQNGLSPAAIRAAGGGASQYNQTKGAPGIAVSVFDAGIFAEDNWTVKPSFTLSYGLRFESQTRIHDHADFGPRLGAAWSISGGKNKPPRAVIRVGGGLFYERFMSTNVLQAKRQNGITQSAIVVNAPDFYPDTCTTNPDACIGTTGSQASLPTIYQINPKLRSPYIFMSGVGVDAPVGKHVSTSFNYMYSRGDHLFITRNINAPLPGTYNPADPTSGVRPSGTNENIYEYESDGASARNRLVINGDFHAKHMGLFGYYMLSKMQSNTAGVSSFASNQYNLQQDYGRATEDLRSRLFLGGFTELPGKISINPFVVYRSSTPFNIVVGQDLNGDSQFNDRPSFATDFSRPSVYKTKFGNFDTQPMAGQTIIPINYGKGPRLFVLNLRMAKSFSFGPVLPEEPAPAAEAKTAEKKPEPKPGKPVKKEIERRYSLGLGLDVDNTFNHRNLAAPVGVLGSSLFGTSTALSSVFGSTQANRTISVETFFRF